MEILLSQIMENRYLWWGQDLTIPLSPAHTQMQLKDGSTGTVALPDLNLRRLEFNSSTYTRCGQFVILLEEESTKEQVQSWFLNYQIWKPSWQEHQVAGIPFNLLTPHEASQLEENQRKLKSLMTLSRGRIFSSWDYGEMRPIGSRLGTGGRPGDGYSPYPSLMVTSIEDIKMLFSHVSVSPCVVCGFQRYHTLTLWQDLECILAKIEPYAPHVTKELKMLGKQANSLGTYGMTAYHCRNYIVPHHYDQDATWTVSYQLKKEHCRIHEFGFSFAHWGCYLETVSNCVWLVVLLWFLVSILTLLTGGSEVIIFTEPSPHHLAQWRLAITFHKV